MDNFRFSTLEYKRPDLEAHRAKLKDWKAAIEHAESYEALRTLLLEMDRENCELSTQYSIANIRHTLNTRDEFYETEVAYLDDTLPTLGGAVQLPCGELAWTKPQIFRVLASVEAMRGVVLGGDVLFGNGTYTGSSWQYCLSCEDHYVAFLRENCRGSRRTAEAFIRDFLATRSGEFLFAPVLREGVDAYIHRSTGGLAPGYDCAARSGCGLP